MALSICRTYIIDKEKNRTILELGFDNKNEFSK